jgi:adenine-specific DNA-methyltransferase
VLLFNGILKDRSVGGGNVLTRPVLRLLRDLLSEESPEFDGELIVYGAACRLSDTTLKAENITFRQTPYEIPARA